MNQNLQESSPVKLIDIDTSKEFTPPHLDDMTCQTTQAEINADRLRFKCWREKERNSE